MLVRIISMVIAGVIIVYLVRWIDNFSPGIANKSCLQCKPNTPICFPLQPMLTKCGHFLILKQENRKSFLLAICGFFLVIQVTFINRLIINCLYNCIAYNMPTFLIYYRLFLT